jgi:hypothetical protein
METGIERLSKTSQQTDQRMLSAKEILRTARQHGVVETDVGVFVISCDRFQDPELVARAASYFRDNINHFFKSRSRHGSDT